jgi:hypothetical protein
MAEGAAGAALELLASWSCERGGIGGGGEIPKSSSSPSSGTVVPWVSNLWNVVSSVWVIRYWHKVLRGWTIGAKVEAWGLKSALELWWPDQLCEDVAEIMSIQQLSPGTKTIQYRVLDLTYKKINHIKPWMRDQGTK